MTDDYLRHTSLHDLHAELGARLIDFGGWSMPVWYDSSTDEHHAVRTSAGLFDLGHMGEIMLTGPDVAEFLDYALLVNASAMAIGRARYTMICDLDGGIIDDLIVYRLGDERFLVVPNASNAARVHAELVDRVVDFTTIIEDQTDQWALVAIQGPQSERILSELVDLDLASIRYYRIDDAEILGQRALIARTGYTGEDGFELFVPSSAGPELWGALAGAGGDAVRPCGLGCRDTLRLEAGMPLYGNELTLDTTPFDVGAGRLVKLDGPDFVGRDALAAKADQPHRHLVGLDVSGRRPARAGYAVSYDGESVGAVTSGAPSPTLDRLIAMASVDRPFEAGDQVTIDVRGASTPATVVDLPFYRRSDKE